MSATFPGISPDTRVTTALFDLSVLDAVEWLRAQAASGYLTYDGTKKVVHGLTDNRDTMFDVIKYWALNLNRFDGVSNY